MKVQIDQSSGRLSVEDERGDVQLGLYTPEAFAILSELWLKVGWTLKYSYRYTWLGRPVIQLPEDLLAIQELLYRLKPDVVIETGVAHGGSLIFHASLCALMKRGRVIGVDIEIRPHNRAALERHELRDLITLVEGSSIDASVVTAVKRLVRPGETALVILDSKHTKDHVLAELEAYAPLVSVGSYIVATDGIMETVADTPAGRPEWRQDNPKAAAEEFVQNNGDFILETPALPFNESPLADRLTYWPSAFLRRQR